MPQFVATMFQCSGEYLWNITKSTSNGIKHIVNIAKTLGQFFEPLYAKAFYFQSRNRYVEDKQMYDN